MNYPEIDWTLNVVRKCQLKEKFASAMIHYLEDNTLPIEENLARDTVLSSKAYLLHEGVLYHLLDAKTKETQ